MARKEEKKDGVSGAGVCGRLHQTLKKAQTGTGLQKGH